MGYGTNGNGTNNNGRMNLDNSPRQRPQQQQYQQMWQQRAGGSPSWPDAGWQKPVNPRRAAPITIQPVPPKPAAPPKATRTTAATRPVKPKALPEVKGFQQGKVKGGNNGRGGKIGS